MEITNIQYGEWYNEYTNTHSLDVTIAILPSHIIMLKNFKIIVIMTFKL